MKRLFLLYIFLLILNVLNAQTDKENKEKFEIAVKSNKLEEVKKLDFLDSVFFNSKVFFSNPLCFVIEETGNIQMIDYLLSKGADNTKFDKGSGSAFSYIPFYWYKYKKSDPLKYKNCYTRYYEKNKGSDRNIKLAEDLIKRGFQYDLFNVLIKAIRYNELDFFKFFIEKNNNEIPVKIHASLMTTACKYNNFDFVKYLTEMGVEVEQVDKNYGSTSLIWANKSYEVSKLLIESGASVHKPDSKGNTPIMHASSSGCTDVVELLISHGADVSIKNKNGKNAIDFTKKYNKDDAKKKEIIRLLKKSM